MAIVARKTLVAGLPYTRTSEESLRRSGITPASVIRDTFDTFVSHAEDSPAFTDRSQTWTGTQYFSEVSSGSVAASYLAVSGAVSFFGVPYTGQVAALTAANLTPLAATYGEAEQGIVENLRTRVLELESALVVYGYLPRRTI